MFPALLAAVVAAGLLAPRTGLAIEPWRNPMIVAVMLLMSLTLPGERLRRAATNVRGLGVCAGVSFGLAPLLAAGVGWAAYRGDPGLHAGFVLVGVLPCTLASAAVWTRMAGGDDALALVFTVASNLASALVVPPLLALLLRGPAVELPVGAMMLDLCLVVLLPVLAGQALRRLLGARADRARAPVGVVAQGLVLAIVLVAVAKLSGDVRARPGLVAAAAGLVLLLHLAAAGAAYALALAAGLPRPERIATVFAGSQKTLFVGVFLAAEHFGHLPLALLPVTAYHVVQLVVDTGLARRFARGAAGAPSRSAAAGPAQP